MINNETSFNGIVFHSFGSIILNIVSYTYQERDIFSF